jgi:hypothetical protein
MLRMNADTFGAEVSISILAYQDTGRTAEAKKLNRWLADRNAHVASAADHESSALPVQ